MADTSLPKPCIVYALASSEDNEIRYIGQTVRTLKLRLKRHRYDAYRDDDTPRARWIRKVEASGYDVLIFPLIENAVPNDDEIRLIAEYRKTHNLLNIVDGGQGCLNPSPEYRQRMSEQRKQYWNTPEGRAKASERIRRAWANADEGSRAKWLAAHKAAMSDPDYRAATSKRSTQMHRNNPEIARQAARRCQALWADPEYRARQAKALAEAMARPEYKKQMSQRMKERWEDPERRLAMSEKMKGREFSDETKLKMSAAAKERFKDGGPAKGVAWSDERKEQFSKALQQKFQEKLADRPLCCDRRMVKLGKCRKGATRYHCKNCGRTTINPYG